jgi:hypothetical protein
MAADQICRRGGLSALLLALLAAACVSRPLPPPVILPPPVQVGDAVFDYVTVHSPRDEEWPRKAHDAMDIRDGFENNGKPFPGVQGGVLIAAIATAQILLLAAMQSWAAARKDKRDAERKSLEKQAPGGAERRRRAGEERADRVMEK